MENYISDFNIFVTDNTNLVYGNGYIESQLYTISSSNIAIGYTNTAFNNTFVIKNIPTTLNFTTLQTRIFAMVLSFQVKKVLQSYPYSAG